MSQQPTKFQQFPPSQNENIFIIFGHRVFGGKFRVFSTTSAGKYIYFLELLNIYGHMWVV